MGSETRNVCLVVAALPPRLDGIGDYTASLALALRTNSKVESVTVVTAERAPASIPGVSIKSAFSVSEASSVWRLKDEMEKASADVIVLQYSPFSFGRWGLNLHLPLVMRSIHRMGQTKVAVMVHEPFVPLNSWQFVIMSLWQRWQLWMLGKCSDVLFFSIDPWVARFQRWFPGQRVVHLPVGSNIPRIPLERAEARARLGIQRGTMVIGLFGTLNPSRMIDQVREAAKAAWMQFKDVQLLYIGPDVAVAKGAFPGIPLLAEGPLSSDEVSKRFAAMDVYLAPYIDGVSTRRTTLMTGLQHGIATVGTRGFLTDNMLAREDGRAILLADVKHPDGFSRCVGRLIESAELRAQIGAGGQCLYEEHFAWNRIAAKLLLTLGQAT